jgi:hypothetical protein
MHGVQILSASIFVAFSLMTVNLLIGLIGELNLDSMTQNKGYEMATVIKSKLTG